MIHNQIKSNQKKPRGKINMTEMVELAEREIKTTIINMFHMFKNVVENMNMWKKKYKI